MAASTKPKPRKLGRPAGPTKLAAKPGCRTVKVKRKGRKPLKKRVCRKPRPKPKPKPYAAKPNTAEPTAKQTPALPLFAEVKPGADPVVAPPAPPVITVPEVPSPGPVPPPPPGTFTRAHAERLLWRAGFGPRPGDVDRFVAMGRKAAVASLIYPKGEAQLVGPEPSAVVDGARIPLQPGDRWGHDHCWWLDRMVRSDQPLVERMTLIWHDWFATSNDKVSSTTRMLAQNALLRRHALGSFADLAGALVHDPAMQQWLDLLGSDESNPNENFARELMELFTLGAGRDAYSETDVRQLARAFTGFRATWTSAAGLHDFRFDPTRHDSGTKTVFGRTGAWGPDDGVRLCLEHPAHASFFVTRLWRQFIPVDPDEATQAAMQRAYVSSGKRVQPVLEIILNHPLLYEGPSMVKAPIVFAAGLLRALGRPVDTADWAWLCDQAGQYLFWPPGVSGWDESRWLDTGTWRGRWNIAGYAIRPQMIEPWGATTKYDETETAAAAVQRALRFCGEPSITAETRQGLIDFAAKALPVPIAAWELGPLREVRQNALRMLVLTCSDLQTS